MQRSLDHLQQILLVQDPATFTTLDATTGNITTVNATTVDGDTIDAGTNLYAVSGVVTTLTGPPLVTLPLLMQLRLTLVQTSVQLLVLLLHLNRQISLQPELIL